MKTLFEFTVNKKELVEEKIEKGNETIITKVEKEVPVTVAIKSPNRTDWEESEIFYSICYAELCNKKLLTNAMVKKMYSEKGGAFSDEELKSIDKLRESVAIKKEEYIKILTDHSLSQDQDRIDYDKLTPELRETLQKKLGEIEGLLKIIQDYDAEYEELFANTAETKAQNQLAFWWILHLPYIKKENDYTPLFKGDNYDFKTKRESYDQIIELDDEFYARVLHRIFILISLWISNKINSREEFQAAYNEFFGEEKIEDEKDEETPKEEKDNEIKNE